MTLPSMRSVMVSASGLWMRQAHSSTRRSDIPTKTVAGTSVDTNNQGFFSNPAQRTQPMAPALTAATGIDPLTHPTRPAHPPIPTGHAQVGSRPSRRLRGGR